MSINRFYRFTLLLPLVIPVVVMIGASIVGLPTFEPLRLLVNAIIGSGFGGALPYSLFALWASWRIGGKSEHDIRRLALRAPVLMVVVFIPVAFVMAAADSDPLGEVLFILIYAVPCILVLGYGYVALVFLVRHLVRNRQWISTSPATAA